MTPFDTIDTYTDGDCTLNFNRSTKILHVVGNPELAQSIIVKLHREEWLPKKLRAIWFSGNPIQLLTGVNLIIYIASGFPKNKKSSRSFSDIVNSKKTS